MTTRYEHFWEMAELPDGTKLYRTNHRRADKIEITWEQRLALMARARRGPPDPNSPEAFYRQERLRSIR